METKISEYDQQALDFLNATNTELEIKFKEFGSMPWDKNKQKRNIFSVTLSNSNHEYTFDFGSSVVDSCGMESEMSQLIESDEIIVYAGLKSVNNKSLSAGIKMVFTKTQLLNADSQIISKYVEQLQDQINSVANDKNKKAYVLFEEGKISRNERDSRLQGAVENGIAYQCIKGAIKRKIDSLNESMVYSKSLQGESMELPSAYDILTCLTKYNPYTFEDFCGDFGYDEDSRSAEQTYNYVKEEWKYISFLFDTEQLEQLREIQ